MSNMSARFEPQLPRSIPVTGSRQCEKCGLVGLRNNAPARGWWFVPGGVVRKNERFEAAFRRISTTELGVTLALSDARFLGPYEHFYDDNFAAANGVGTHYVVLAWEIRVPTWPNSFPQDQHSDYRWVSVAELATDASIHHNTRAYAAALESA